MKPMTTMLLLAAMLACSACADKTVKTATLATNERAFQIVTAATWEDTVAASTAAHVNNNFLLQQR